jgi:adenine phosphoribosyltransferase
MDLKEHIRGIPDFPKPGILFYDISTLLAHPDAWQVALGRLAHVVSKHQPDLLAGIASWSRHHWPPGSVSASA